MSSNSIYSSTIKQCSKCTKLKSIIEFTKDKQKKDGYRGECKQCRSQYRTTNTDIADAYAKEYRKKNAEKIAAHKKQYHAQHKEKFSVIGKEYKRIHKEEMAAYGKTYRENNSVQIAKVSAAYRKHKYNTDPLYKLRHNHSASIRDAIKKIGSKKNSRTVDVLGCSIAELKQHIERQFSSGMTWDNHGEWHIDHIVPVSFGQTEDEIILLNHYSNFQPLWALDNFRKKDKITEDAISHPIYNVIINKRVTTPL